MVDTVNDFIRFVQPIEGQRIADLEWGTANAKQIIINGIFDFSNSTSFANQTFCLAVQNAALTRTYVANIYTAIGVSSINDLPFTIVIPGCTDGVWPTDNSLGMNVMITGWCGTKWRTAPNVWAAGDYKGSTTMSSELPSSIGGTWSIRNMGMYSDPEKTGVAPVFVPPKYEDALRESQRYWFKGTSQRGYTSSTTVHSHCMALNPYPMRIINPSVAFVGTINCYDATTTVAASAVSANRSSMNYFYNAFTTAAVVAARPGGHILGGTGYVAVSARM